ncbi:MAG TPA: site-specific DNA-methyltransferase [Candidatus Hydrogenedentes bacterium]|nr:site-specific DNA-methyltransferase [Candidatus Hydrogenedentota bacterium]
MIRRESTRNKKKQSPKSSSSKSIETLRHYKASRKNIPTVEHQSVMQDADKSPLQVAYERRNRDLDPQLVWRGKDQQDWSDLVTQAPPLYIQEKIHPKVLIDDLLRQSKARKDQEPGAQTDLFADFNGLPDTAARTEFYQHNANWTNRMILGDSLQVMASLAEREGLRGQVQCIYIDPPYGIKFNSNFQWSTTSRDVKDGNKDHISREPEQVKAFRDTWRDGIHSYLTYLRDRLTVARDLLTESGSIFVQIGDENVHRVRALMDEVFGEQNFAGMIAFFKTSSQSTLGVQGVVDYLVVYAKQIEHQKVRRIVRLKAPGEAGAKQYVFAFSVDLSEMRRLTPEEVADPTLVPAGWRIGRPGPTTSQGHSDKRSGEYKFRGESFNASQGRHWSYDPSPRAEMDKLSRLNRLRISGKGLATVLLADDNPATDYDNVWMDTGTGSFTEDQIYVVQTANKVIQRCIQMTTDPGDLVLDPTCGSGTTAYVAEQWGRRWITIDTSRVALALARARIMGARYPYYLLADSKEGQIKEAEVTRTAPKMAATHGDIRQGFVYERVPHITLKSIANNMEIDVIWEKWQKILEPLRESLNKALSTAWEEWEIPREADKRWSAKAKELHGKWWEARITRQKEIDASIAAKAEFEYLYDKPYEDKRCVRVAGPFTVESLSPHRVLTVDEDDALQDSVSEEKADPYRANGEFDFGRMVLDHLKTSGVQQAHKEDRITFTSITGWPGKYIGAEGRFMEGEIERRAGILIGPEYGTVSRPDLVAAAREAGDAGFDVLIACAFNFEAHSSEFNKLGRIPILKARMNPDLHMADELKNTGAGNLFVVFGEPDINIEDAGNNQIRVKINGVDVFHPQTGEIASSGPEGIACWFIDTDYNEESFFVRHAYFLGANDPYKSLKTTLKAEIDQEAWQSLYSDISRPFDKPASGRIAVKVINHLGDEVMKVFGID